MYLLKMAFRYSFSKQNKQRQTNIMIIIGIALGFTAFIIVIGLMNSLQKGQLDSLKALESFDIIVEDATQADINQIKDIEGVETAFYFYETPAIAVNISSGQSTYLRIRAFENDIILKNTRFENFLKWTFEKPSSISNLAIAHGVALNLGAKFDSELKLTILKKGKTATLMPYNFTSKVDSIFYTGISEINNSTIYFNYNILEEYLGLEERKIGILLSSDKYLESVASQLPNSITWKKYNASLYQALLLEKFIVFLFLSFILIIVCVNLKNSTKRMIKNKQTESAILCTFGMTKKKVTFIYSYQAFFISIIALILGSLISSLIAQNLKKIFRFISQVIFILSGRTSIFSFLPVQIIISSKEIILFSIFILFFTWFFTQIGLRPFRKSEIMGVIRHEKN
ncbi:MAG: FtsX-like permease family protein [Sphaerochaetaceae bacterium]